MIHPVVAKQNLDIDSNRNEMLMDICPGFLLYLGTHELDTCSSWLKRELTYLL